MRPGSRLEVTAHDLDVSGFGVAAADGIEVRVKDLLPGERAAVEVEHQSPHAPRCWARILEHRGAPAAERVEPMCPAVGECGGCAWQHLAYPAQLMHKRARVVRALAGRGMTAAVAPMIAAPAETGYRNYGKYIAATENDLLILGGYRPRSHSVVDLRGCRVVEPIVETTRAAAVRAAAHLPVYDEERRMGALRYVLIRAGTRGEALVALVTTAGTPVDGVRTAAEALFRDPVGRALAGVVWVRNDRSSGALLTDDIVPLIGRPTVTESVAGVDIDIAIGDFVQINRAQARRLYAEVAHLAGDSCRIADLYCGVGGIAFALAQSGRQRGIAREIVAIERNPGAVSAARRAAAAAGLAIDFRVGDAATLETLCTPGAPLDLVVVNPPRKGLGAATRDALRRARPGRIIYVSCGPDSLARDLALLADSYAIDGVQPFDLMPGTAQVETVVTLTRAAAPTPG